MGASHDAPAVCIRRAELRQWWGGGASCAMTRVWGAADNDIGDGDDVRGALGACLDPSHILVNACQKSRQLDKNSRSG
jgi:hypothetical protein